MNGSRKTAGWMAIAVVTCHLSSTFAEETQGISWEHVGAKVSANYKGDGLSVQNGLEGAALHCVFQRLDGEATAGGLWLISNVTNQAQDRFRVMAVAVGRQTTAALEPEGAVSMTEQMITLSRPRLLEEYSVSVDGVRQDFVVTTQPPGVGELQVRLEVTGARVMARLDGLELTLESSGRKIAYTRLRATDAKGKELPARIEANSNLVLVVNDEDAVYPVRIDPTFSDANWVSMGGLQGTSGTVAATVVDALGNLYVGGIFKVAGNTSANNIAKWDGTNWSPLGTGLTGLTTYNFLAVRALAISGNKLYAGGSFTNAGGITANNIAQWDGTNWAAVGTRAEDFLNNIEALAAFEGNLYAGGVFTEIGGIPANFVARWDGSTWSGLGSGVNNTVMALAASGNTLYAGGAFTNAGGVSANYVAKWDGTGWSSLGSGLDSYANALAASGNTLYAGGRFTNAGGEPANYIARWDGTNWSSLSLGMNGQVAALAISGSMLYAGGSFSSAGGTTAEYVALWDGTNWSTLNGGMSASGYVGTLSVSGGTLYAGGAFTNAGGVPANYIAQWIGTNWTVVGTSITGRINALAVSGDTLFAGGRFKMAGATSVNCIAQWNGSGWLPLGTGMSGGISGPEIYALASSGSNLFAAGNFTTAGGNPATYVAEWNGKEWAALGSGVGGTTPVIYALALSGSNLYAGGQFTIAGGSAASHVARWDGSNWGALGTGVNTNVNALVVSGSNLYAGGRFTNAGGVTVNYIAQWNGSSWSALGGGMNGVVNALMVSSNALYAGGAFTVAGGVTADCIAKWNGNNWSALGFGMGGGDSFGPYVGALAQSGNTIYAGGDFTTVGTDSANYLARWDGTNWAPVGSGLGGVNLFKSGANALTISGNRLYAGGNFTTAGGKASWFAATAMIGPPDLIIGPMIAGTTVSWQDTGIYTLQQNTNLSTGAGWITSGYPVSSNNGVKKVLVTPSSGSIFFRLMQQ